MSSIDSCDMYSSIGLWRDCLAVLMTVSSLTLVSLYYRPSVLYFFPLLQKCLGLNSIAKTKTEMEGLQNKLFNNLITLYSMLLLILVLMLPLNV